MMKYLFNFILIFFFFNFSLYILELYISGDQQHYINYYNNIKGEDLLSAYVDGFSYLSAVEPFSLLILWIGSNLDIDKVYYISFFNTILFSLLLLIINKYKFKFLPRFFFISNFYFIVLYTGAERLKFLFIPLLLSILVENKFLKKILMFSYPFFHLQGVLFLIFEFLKEFKFFSFSKKFFYFLFSVFLSILAFPFFSGKFYSYFILDQLIISEITQVIILSIILFYITRDTMTALLFVFFFSFLSLSFGSSRITIIAFFSYLTLLLEVKKINHPLNTLLLFYFFIKSLFFIDNIIIYGDGFVTDN